MEQQFDLLRGWQIVTVIFSIITMVYVLVMPFLIWLELRRVNDKLDARLMQERFRAEREEEQNGAR